MKYFIILLTLTLVQCKSNAQNKTQIKMDKKLSKSESDWKNELSTQEYYVLRQKGTDKPSESGYTNHFEKGTYACNACKIPLFASKSKFKSHCGWPSFDDALEGTVIYTKDTTLGMIRTEITCANCESHLGHIFEDGPVETTGKRYCVNTSSIVFVKE